VNRIAVCAWRRWKKLQSAFEGNHDVFWRRCTSRTENIFSVSCSRVMMMLIQCAGSGQAKDRNKSDERHKGGNAGCCPPDFVMDNHNHNTPSSPPPTTTVSSGPDGSPRVNGHHAHRPSVTSVANLLGTSSSNTTRPNRRRAYPAALRAITSSNDESVYREYRPTISFMYQ